MLFRSTPVTINVLVNDSDPDGDTITVSSVQPVSTHGTVVIVGGQPKYTPNAGFTGFDIFEYTISDGRGGTATAITSIYSGTHLAELKPPVLRRGGGSLEFQLVTGGAREALRLGAAQFGPRLQLRGGEGRGQLRASLEERHLPRSVQRDGRARHLAVRPRGLWSGASPGGDLSIGEDHARASRNFATKFWNATRFAEMNGAALPRDFDPATVKLNVNKWMLGELARANQAVDRALSDFRLNEAAAALYEFVWGIVCDWYVELTKPIVQGPDGVEKDETRAVTAYVLRETAKLLHPVMPFITEEIWDKTGHRAEHGALIGQPWPKAPATDEAADGEMGWLVRLISDIRSARSELNVPAGAKLKLMVVGGDATTKLRLKTHEAAIERLARVEGIEAASAAPKGALQIVVGEATYALPVGDVIDLKAESARLAKEIKKLADEIAKIDAKLGNANFMARAPEDVVEEQRDRRRQAEQTRQRLVVALQSLGG